MQSQQEFAKRCGNCHCSNTVHVLAAQHATSLVKSPTKWPGIKKNPLSFLATAHKRNEKSVSHEWCNSIFIFFLYLLYLTLAMDSPVKR